MRVNAVFQGGGVKGIALVGAVYTAQSQGITFHQTAGTSVGAVVAALLTAGYSAEEMRDMLMDTPFQRFTQRDWYHYIYFVGPAMRLFVKKGLYSGDPLEAWIAAHLKRKGIVTFGDLPKHALRVVASDITQGRLLVLPDDIQEYGVDPLTLSVAKAVRMSASLPFFFEPVIYRPKRTPGSRKALLRKKPLYIVDGAILSNYPLWIFDKDMKESPSKIPTLGFQLVGKTEEGPRSIHGPISMFSALFSTMMTAHDERYIEKHSRFRTIKIPSNMAHTTEFTISREKMSMLFESGIHAADEFFSGWSHAGYSVEMDKWIKTIHSSREKNAGSPLGPPANL